MRNWIWCGLSVRILSSILISRENELLWLLFFNGHWLFFVLVSMDLYRNYFVFQSLFYFWYEVLLSDIIVQECDFTIFILFGINLSVSEFFIFKKILNFNLLIWQFPSLCLSVSLSLSLSVSLSVSLCLSFSKWLKYSKIYFEKKFSDIWQQQTKETLIWI